MFQSRKRILKAKTTEKQPVSTEKQPVSTEKQPVSKEKQPVSTKKQGVSGIRATAKPCTQSLGAGQTICLKEKGAKP